MLIQLAILCARQSVNKNYLDHTRKFASRMSLNSLNDTSTVSALISANEALTLRKCSDVKFLDGSWGLDKKRNHTEEYLQSRIPGARWFDLEQISDTSQSLPHMLPSAEFLAESISNLGISSTDYVIVYATPGCFSAPRIWWTFKAFGHKRVSVLNGGLKAWIAEGGEVASGAVTEAAEKGNFTARIDPRLVYNWRQVLAVVNNGHAQLLDARSAGRFTAQAPEPRPHLAGGHIPGSLNLPMTAVLEEDLVTFKPIDDIRKAFEDAGVVVESGAAVITTCGSGVSAAVLSLCLNLLGRDIATAPVYDGSWTEWGARADLPIAK